MMTVMMMTVMTTETSTKIKTNLTMENLAMVISSTQAVDVALEYTKEGDDNDYTDDDSDEDEDNNAVDDVDVSLLIGGKGDHERL